MKKTRFALFQSIVALVLCLSMLIGTTFALFSDSVTSSNNIITSGKLDVSMYWADDYRLETAAGETAATDMTEWKDASEGSIFDYEYWEPGYTDAKFVKISNEGNLALTYRLYIVPETPVAEGEADLADVIDVYILPAEEAMELTREQIAGLTPVGTLSALMTNPDGAARGILLPVDGSGAEDVTLNEDDQQIAVTGEDACCIILKMQETAGNEYQNKSAGNGFSVRLVATQYTWENDSFGNDYDTDAIFEFPEIEFDEEASGGVTPDGSGLLANDVTLTGGETSATVFAGSKLADGAAELTLTVNSKDQSDSNVTLGKNEDLRALDVHVEGLAPDNTVPVLITIGKAMPVGLNMGNYKLYHVEAGGTNEMTLVDSAAEFTAHNQFKYDPATGDITLYMATFSEVTLVADKVNAWNGDFDYDWYDASKTELTIANADQLAAFGAIVGGMDAQEPNTFFGKTVKLIADVNLGDAEGNNNADIIFYPIGYYNSEGTYEKTSTAITSGFKTFEGIFDGQGHTISNFYQNTWEMKGDNEYYSPAEQCYRDGMGLFGKVYGGTVKNLTVANFSSDGEYTTTGVIAAYADGATFQNIAIINSNPRVYNIGNGGIVGCVGWYANEAGLKTTFSNITVDNSNKISALWGSYDVACGGIVGQYYPTSGQSSAGNPANGGIDFENCHVAAQMDVYNDVCGNYMYYAYRYAGMIIGSIRENETINGYVYPKMDGITAKNCTVNYGTWNNYYYCEFESNGHPSYAAADEYKFSRVPESALVRDGDGKVTGCTHKHSDVEDNRAVYLPFDQLFTGYGWGVTSKGVKDFEGIETINVDYGNQEESVEKFKAKEGIYAIEEAKAYKLSELFSAIDESTIKSDAVTIGVTDIDNDDTTVTAEFVANSSDWKEGTVTFTNQGTVVISIQDYQFCTPTELVVEIADAEDIRSQERFEVVFPNTDKYLYRVGNKNPISISSLFAAKDGVESTDIGNVTIEVADANITKSQTWEYKEGTEWNDGTIDFADTFTGPVTITISDDNYSEALSLDVEVINAYNVTAYSELQNRNSVLLNRIDMRANSTFHLNNATLYGNGFEFDVTAAKDGDTTNGYIGGNYAVSLRDANLDNIRIIGEVYTQYGAQAKSMYNYPTVLTNGNSIIANSYISHCASPVRAQDGNLQIINTTLEGGIFANLDIRGGIVNLDNVVTINQSTADGASVTNDKKIVGLGIVFYECNVNARLNIATNADGSPRLKQYNMISKNTTFNDGNVNTLKNSMFGPSHEDLQYTDSDGVVWINPCIISATEGITNMNVWGNNQGDIQGYTGKPATVYGNNGYVLTIVPTAVTKPNEYESLEQYNILPDAEFNHNTAQNESPSADSNEHCYYNSDTQKLEISFDQGKNKVYDPNILTVTKVGEKLPYTVKIDGIDYTGKTITFTEKGSYTAVYEYTDPYNFRVNDKDEVEQFPVSYTKVLLIEVSVVEATAKDAKFTFYGYSAISKTAATTITDVKTVTSSSGNLYIMPSSTGTYVTAKTIDGITVNCPRVYVDFKNNTSDFNWLYPVFLGVKIEDYADGGTAETATTIVSPTSSSKPTNLTILTVDKPTGGGGWSSGSGKSGSEGKLSSGTYKNLYGWTSGALGSDQPANSIYGQFTYKDNKGTTYYYVIEFYRNEHDCPTTCVTPDTLITLADGKQVRIDSLTGNEQLLVWNHETGAFDTAPVAYIVNHDEKVREQNITHLYFSDGSEIKVINEHVFYDATLNKYIALTDENAGDYLGHEFAGIRSAKHALSKVKLVKVEKYMEETSAYEVVSYKHLTCFTSNILSTSAYLDKLLNVFDINSATMAYTPEKVMEDIATYGLYTYEDFEDLISEKAFELYNAAYLKIAVGKGYITWDDILDLIDVYFDVDVQPIQ